MAPSGGQRWQSSCSFCCALLACSCSPCGARRCGAGPWRLAAATCVWQSGLSARRLRASSSSGRSGCSPGLPVIVLGGLSIPPLRRAAAGRARLPQDQGHPAQGLRHRAGGARSRHRRLRRRAVLRHSPTGSKLRAVPPITLTRGGAGLPRRPDRRAVPHDRRLADPPQPSARSPRRSGTSSRSTASSAC